MSVGGDKVSNAVWRAGEGGAVEALGRAGMAVQTDVFVLLGINDIMAAQALGKKGAVKGLVSDIVGGVYFIACVLKKELRSEHTRIHILEVPLLPRGGIQWLHKYSYIDFMLCPNYQKVT